MMRVHLPKDTGPTNYYKFPWIRYRCGFRLERRLPRSTSPLKPHDDNPIERLYLTADEEKGTPSEIYYPLEEHPGLARKFAEISDPDAVLQFAVQYGVLGLDGLGQDSGDEDVMMWLLEASQLRRALGVWDLLDSKDMPGLREIFKWKDKSVIARFPNSKATRWITSPGNQRWLQVWKPGDVIGPAKLFLAEEFNRVMNVMASPTILLDAKGNFKTYSVPVSLLAAMWLEFSEIVTGVRKLQPCELCGRLMDVTDNRRHKRMHDNCSLRLRMARYRRAQKE